MYFGLALTFQAFIALVWYWRFDCPCRFSGLAGCVESSLLVARATGVAVGRWRQEAKMLLRWS